MCTPAYQNSWSRSRAKGLCQHHVPPRTSIAATPDHLARQELFHASENHFYFIAAYIPAPVWAGNADGSRVGLRTCSRVWWLSGNSIERELSVRLFPAT